VGKKDRHAVVREAELAKASVGVRADQAAGRGGEGQRRDLGSGADLTERPVERTVGLPGPHNSVAGAGGQESAVVGEGDGRQPDAG
jgi:hypothetical protein